MGIRELRRQYPELCHSPEEVERVRAAARAEVKELAFVPDAVVDQYQEVLQAVMKRFGVCISESWTTEEIVVFIVGYMMTLKNDPVVSVEERLLALEDRLDQAQDKIGVAL